MVSFEEADKLAKANNLVYIETSAKEGTHVNTAFEDVSLQVLRAMGNRPDPILIGEPIIPKKKTRNDCGCTIL
jgi:hypothetical protein